MSGKGNNFYPSLVAIPAEVLSGMPDCEGIHANEMVYGAEYSIRTICLENGLLEMIVNFWNVF